MLDHMGGVGIGRLGDWEWCAHDSLHISVGDVWHSINGGILGTLMVKERKRVELAMEKYHRGGED